jgi:hypothetical protein
MRARRPVRPLLSAAHLASPAYDGPWPVLMPALLALGHQIRSDGQVPLSPGQNDPRPHVPITLAPTFSVPRPHHSLCPPTAGRARRGDGAGRLPAGDRRQARGRQAFPHLFPSITFSLCPFLSPHGCKVDQQRRLAAGGLC